MSENKVALTDRSLQALRPSPDGKRRVVWDAILPGMAVRVSPRGKRSFYAVRRPAGQQQPVWHLVGVYPVTPLAKAREAAREALGKLMAGENLRDTKIVVAAKTTPSAPTFRAVADLFIAKHLPKLRTARPYEALIGRELIPAWGERPIGDIRRRDVLTLIRAIAARGVDSGRTKGGGEYAARHAIAAARKLFNWALTEDIDGVDSNPCAGIKVADLLGSPSARDRVLSDAELRLVWRAAEAKSTPYPFGPLIHALLLSGQRLREIAEARWSEIDGGMLVIPAERMKGMDGKARPHALPLTERITALLDTLPRFTSGEYLFTTTAGRRPISGYSKMKARFDSAVAKLVAADRAELVAAGATEAEAVDRIRDVAHWTLHDLRRTVRTGLAAAGIAPFFAELVIAHQQAGVHGVYDLHRYDAEKRDALERWEKRLLAIVAPEPTAPNVVNWPARATA